MRLYRIIFENGGVEVRKIARGNITKDQLIERIKLQQGIKATAMPDGPFEVEEIKPDLHQEVLAKVDKDQLRMTSEFMSGKTMRFDGGGRVV